MARKRIKGKLKRINKSKKLYTYDIYTVKGKHSLGEIVFTDNGETCDFCCKLEKEEYYGEVFYEIFLTVLYKLFKLGYKGVRIIPKNQVELQALLSFGFKAQEDGSYFLESRNNYKVRINEENQKEFQYLYSSMMNDERILKMKEVSQHRGSNSYEHVLKVTRLAYRISKGLHVKADYYSMIRAAILHDYYLYDWRKQPEKKPGHGHNHPYIAMTNADKDFKINYLEKLVIIEHMWPINLLNFPKSWEARIVSYADKVVSTLEALTSKRFKAHFRRKTLKKLKTL